MIATTILLGVEEREVHPQNLFRRVALHALGARVPGLDVALRLLGESFVVDGDGLGLQVRKAGAGGVAERLSLA